MVDPQACVTGFKHGDAMGAPLEYSDRDSRCDVTDMEWNYHYNLPPGSGSDRTAHMLCVADCIQDHNDFDPGEYLANYYQLVVNHKYCPQKRAFSVSYFQRLTAQKIGLILRYKRPIPVCLNPEDIHQDDCEPLFKVAPIVAKYYQRPKYCLDLVERIVKLTHISHKCIDSAKYLASLLIARIIGVDKRDLLSDKYNVMDVTTYGRARNGLKFMTREYIENCSDCTLVAVNDEDKKIVCKSTGKNDFLRNLSPAVNRVRLGSYQSKTRDQIVSDYHIINCLEAALWAFHHSSDLDSGCKLACNLGMNAPTIGAIVGALWGASQ